MRPGSDGFEQRDDGGALRVVERRGRFCRPGHIGFGDGARD